ncbi:Down syndrome cell adhesion molecule-like protein Dscam2 isoform X2 [Anopheles albimanus]|nr:Down syndrome cell adhesion molecule-like protein Dscam2 isoform X2 [Anopheles albimanus]XP_035789899.1 Down syndrome cell adhesion molecule-like protein Dscam2 isoform X2 [Anopheles albimanus]XP_035789900.1 Down syndrome cell adhesion molecule-like protein Dscam2 isoform X2 [Anopheles albimanus]XP_035789902.1 Down syndrome cell adhesion molecule-like protein Dscam2 isoform X2 [Anopheles albimanus]XP_035789903.1 Down syndrome cell adhesion molecule-like protein Dscam2 isoform X2 [Anopheles a
MATMLRYDNGSLWMFFIVVWLNYGLMSAAFDSHLRGPSFVMEPPSRLEFSNSSGGWLDCSASGSPQPTIDWLSVDGTSVGDVGGVRRVLRNGTLVLLPFPAAAYRQDIHSTIYRCVASNTVGRVISRDVQVRAVVAQAYKVDVEVLAASRGCTAILRCVVPNFVKELVRVVSWVQEPAFYIYPSLQGDGKHHLLPTGELLIHNLEFNDRYPSYRCRTMHKLTRQVVTSNPAKIRMTDQRGIVSPSVVEHTSHVAVSQDEGAVLLCVAQGCPSPEYRWYTHNGPEPIPVTSGPRIRLLGPVLAIEAVTGEDGGVYKCSAANAGGEASADLRLTVSTPIHVEISPNVLSVHMGGTAEFRCLVTSNGMSAGPQHITWFKDGRQLPSSGRVGDTLQVTGVTREDKGMYQCVVRRQEGDSFQASAELQLGDAPPSLVYSFIEQTLQPGPAVSLKCSAQGNPTPQISWSLDGFPLPTNGRFMIGQYVTVHGDVISHVNISHVMVEDGGEYSCVAENRAGKTAHSARLNIYGLPYIRLIPKVTAVAGHTLYLKCPVAGYPIEEIHWERGGRELPEDMRQKVQSDGTLEIKEVQKSLDSGVYTCWARNKQGHSARRSGEVAVIVPPNIEPFSFQDGLAEGMRTRTVCGVSKGDPPLTLKWLKDGDPLLSTLLGANVSTLDQYSSLLNIPSLSAAHSGDYTCVASNPAAEVKFTASLQVKVPPRWVVEPTDVSVERNRHIMLHCQAQGVPVPTILWKKATGSKSGDYEEVRERPYTKLLANGSLLLQHVKEDREGFYLCQANNGIGTGIGKVIQLKVNSSPYFAGQSKMVTVKKGDTAMMQCEVKGDKPINVVWLRNGKHELNPSTNYRVSIKQDATPEGISAEVQISNVDSSDSGAYFCQASNLYGRDQQLVQLQVQEPPQPPSSLEAATVSSRVVNLKWQPRGGDAAEVSKYIVEYREIDRQWQYIEISDPPVYSTIIENLKPATNYVFRIIAEGPAGRSSPSQELFIKTDPQRPAGPPLNLGARPISSTEILVSWMPPSYELRHGEMQGYNIGYRSMHATSNSYNFTSISGDGEDGTGELLLTNLAKYTRYTIVAQAFNQIGPGPLSEPVTAQTMEDVPSKPPEDIRCMAQSSTSIQVSWQPPQAHHTNGLLQGYKVFYECATEDAISTGEMETRKTTSLTVHLSNLRKFSNYSIQVLAYTRMGDGVISPPSFCHTDEDAPEAPADIKIAISSPSSLYVSWLPPKDPNGIITKYNLYMRAVNGREELNNDKRNLLAHQHHFEAKQLQSHTEYQFWVSASTRVGEGKSSRVVSQLTSNRVPAKIVSFGGLTIRPWKSSASLNCLAVGAPRREWFKGDTLLRAGTQHNIQLLDSGEMIVTMLQTSDTGNYTCQVDNGIGTDRLTHNLLVQVPPGPPVLYVTSATSSSILLHWKIGSTGNAPITAFSLHYRRVHGNLEEMQLSRHATSHDLKGLFCGSTYQVYLVAHNKIGSSSASTTLNVKTQGQPPGIPPDSVLIAPNSTSVVLRLNGWPDNGCPIIYFVLQYRSVSIGLDDDWHLVSNALKPQRRFTLSGLLPSTMYRLKMEAHNVAGSTNAEYTFWTLTKDGDPPPPELVQRGHRSQIFYNNIQLLIPIIITITATIICIAFTVVCYKYRQRGRQRKDTMESQQTTDAQRDRYYATIHKVALQAGDKIPETSEDISPYATFQLSEASTLAQPHHSGPANTLLHSFMYHERAMTEGCASPPPAAVLRLHNQSPYYNINSSKGRRRHSRKTEPESEESDSDQDPLTSSRTESSNQLDAKMKHSKDLDVQAAGGPGDHGYNPNHYMRSIPGLIYHGTQSSTSSDLSPMSEQKSLPRRGRSSQSQTHHIYMPRGTMRSLLTPLHLPDGSAPGGGPLFHQVPIEAGTPDRIELSEAECDIDTIKKLKLGMRSSLWSRPSQSNNVGAAGPPGTAGSNSGNSNNNNNNNNSSSSGGGAGGNNSNNINNNGNNSSAMVGSILGASSASSGVPVSGGGAPGGNAAGVGHPSDYSIAV